VFRRTSKRKVPIIDASNAARRRSSAERKASAAATWDVMSSAAPMKNDTAPSLRRTADTVIRVQTIDPSALMNRFSTQ
jgi:hypothetical protein